MWTQGPPAVSARGLPHTCLELSTGTSFTAGSSTTGTFSPIIRMVCSKSNSSRTTKIGNVDFTCHAQVTLPEVSEISGTGGL